MRARGCLFVISLSVALLAGCGGGGAPPAGPDHAAASAGDAGASETFGTPHPDDLAAMDAGGAPATGSGSAAGSAASGSAGSSAATATAAAPEPKDECTPVGVEFEKRARPKLKDCYAEGKKKDPNLKGTVKISVDIDTLGKVKTIKILEKTLPDPVAQCMLKVVKATPLTEASKCPGKSLTIPVTFPTPR